MQEGGKKHDFRVTTFQRPTYCSFVSCGGFLWGLKNQGVSCSHCGFPVHHKCAPVAMMHSDCGDVNGHLRVGAGKHNKATTTTTTTTPTTTTTTTPTSQSYVHPLQRVTFTRPTYCGICHEFIWGLALQGFRCALCHLNLHPKCVVRSHDITCDTTKQESNNNINNNLLSSQEVGEEEEEKKSVADVEYEVAPAGEGLGNEVGELTSEEEGCVICMERPKDTLFLPCKHLCVCTLCCKPLKECPVCRKEIAQKVEGIYVV